MTRIIVVDSFTARPFAGNPAAVVVLDAFPDDARMGAIAAEMNLAETAFVVARGDGEFDLRWFTPTVEVPLCGHATLAAAHVLGRRARFHTLSGVLDCHPGDDRAGDDGDWIEMDFPAAPALPLDDRTELDRLAQLFDLELSGAASSSFLILETPAADTVRSYAPDLAVVARAHEFGVIVTAPGDRPGLDCVSRVFVPNVGIAEDPVTGAAHCMLASWWAQRTGHDELVGEQASRRGGIVRMTRSGDRVLLGGQAVTVAEVTLLA